MQLFFLVVPDRAITVLLVMDKRLLLVAVEKDFLTLLEDTNQMVASTDACKTGMSTILKVSEVEPDSGIDVVAHSSHCDGIARIDKVLGF